MFVVMMVYGLGALLFISVFIPLGLSFSYVEIFIEIHINYKSMVMQQWYDSIAR